MNLKGKMLDEWLATCTKEKFPGGGSSNYCRRYEQIKEYLDRDVHPHVNALAMRRDGGYLTDHGPEHIKTVIQRASRLAESPGCCLTPLRGIRPSGRHSSTRCRQYFRTR